MDNVIAILSGKSTSLIRKSRYVLVALLALGDFQIALGGYLYDTNRHFLQGSPEEACKKEVYSPYNQNNNFAGVTYTQSPWDYTCQCHSNPGNDCGYVRTYCPAGFASDACHKDDKHGTICRKLPDCVRIDAPDREKNLGDACGNMKGNPINTATGNKYQKENDIALEQSQLFFTRYYNSQVGGADVGYGVNWRNNYSSYIDMDLGGFVDGSYTVASHVTSIKAKAKVIRADGQAYYFDNFYDIALGVTKSEYWVSENDISDTLKTIYDGAGNISGFELRDKSNAVEVYDIHGKLRSIRDLRGNELALSYITYPSGTKRLGSVVSNRGGKLTFSYDNNERLSSIKDTSGRVWGYQYDANGNLEYVVYPGVTSSTNVNSPRRQYHYEDRRFPQYLTGITDELGNRYATWRYDELGRAISSEHAAAAERTTLAFNADGSTTVTNALGKQTTYHFTTIHGVQKVTNVEGHATGSCAGANKAYSYDTNGFLVSKTDWSGNQTAYVRNAKGQEISRTEAVGTPEERTITTEWHTEFNLPTRITEPGKITVMSYDRVGQLLSRVVQSK